MKLLNISKLAFGCVLLWQVSFANADQINTKPNANNPFDKCQFSIRETEHLKLKIGASWADSEQHTCVIETKQTNNNVLNPQPAIFIIGSDQYEAERTSGAIVGFIQGENGKWTFQGNAYWLLSPKFLKRTFTQDQTGGETLLVGKQIVRGSPPNANKGGYMDLPATMILRITPEFVVSLEAGFNFMPTAKPSFVKDYPQLYEAYNKELVEIVKSVQPAPGIAGPYVRAIDAR
jgi:hypothetical protein